jgi:hypothetical protein
MNDIRSALDAHHRAVHAFVQTARPACACC